VAGGALGGGQIRKQVGYRAVSRAQAGRAQGGGQIRKQVGYRAVSRAQAGRAQGGGQSWEGSTYSESRQVMKSSGAGWEGYLKRMVWSTGVS